jgi:hypothetical protein
MNGILQFSPGEVVPGRDAVLANQGIPPGTAVSAEIDDLASAALELLATVAEPAGLLDDITAEEFRRTYEGDGRNEPETPAADACARADYLALFAVTLGPAVGLEIDRRFRSSDLALASMLDAAASAAADELAAATERRYARHLAGRVDAVATTGVLRYSPGYCGWHISGQRRVFARLRPERIGLTLRESFLMEPLKSVSGVLIAGPIEIHDASASYPFCERCTDRGCRQRVCTVVGE